MSTDDRELLTVLKKELEFLEKGGYRHTMRAPWRPHFIFQDSPTCLNFDTTQVPRPCCDCVLTQFVPEDSKRGKIPCRYIPLNERGETIDWFYKYGTQDELEAAMKQWLGKTIARLENEKAENLRVADHTEVHVQAKFVPYD